MADGFPEGGEFVVNGGPDAPQRRLAMPIYIGPMVTYTIHPTICGATFEIRGGSLEKVEEVLCELLSEYLWVTNPNHLMGA